MVDRELFRRRREALLSRLEGGVAVVSSAAAVRRNGDVEFPFRQDSDLYYLTGFPEPKAVAVFSRVHNKHRFVLFVRPHDKEKETWSGPRAGIEGAVADWGADAAFPIEALEQELPKYLEGAQTLYYRLGEQPESDARVIAALAQLRARTRVPTEWPRHVVDLGEVVHELRLFKSPEEIVAIRRSAAATAGAHHAAMREARPGMREFELQAVLEFHFRRAGGDAGFQPIVASGPNATVLHYHGNDRLLTAGDVVLVDAGAEIDCYTADISRTFPVGPKFSASQRAAYELVLGAQKAAIDMVRPGATVDEIHQATVARLAQGMVDLGWCEGPVDKVVQTEAYKKYYMHRTSHWLGMDVHDAGRYFLGGKPRALEPGMVITIEPGLYVGPNETGAGEEWRGLGVRIEDDVLVTPGGHEVLTLGVPKEIADVEATRAG